MNVVRDLTYVIERSRSTFLNPNQYTSVKEQNHILDCLKRQQPLVDHLVKSFPELDYVKQSMTKWVMYMGQFYPETPTFLGPPYNLKIDDAKELFDECNKWLDSIITCFGKSGLEIIKEESIQDLFSNITDKLDDDAKKDLDDTMNCLLHLFPTASAMLTLRVAERILRKYYQKITGREPEDRMWGQMINELEQTNNVHSSIIGYLKYLNQKRIDVAHPYKRYEQEESERMLLKLKDLLDEIPP